MVEFADFSLSLQSIMDKMRTFFAFMVPLLLLSACGGGRGNEQLARVDSLVIAEAYDSAYQTLMAIDERDITTDADRAHYNLLTLQYIRR